MKKTTTYVESLDENIEISLNYAIENEINTILLFTKDGKAAIRLKKLAMEKSLKLNIIAVSFPSNEIMYVQNDKDSDKIDEIIPATSNKDTKDLLSENGIPLILTSMPFEDIIVPGSNYHTYNIIKETLSLVYSGLDLSIQSVLMATDTGYIQPQERVISLTKLSSIDVMSSNVRLLYHPLKGLKINHLITRPK